MNLNDLLLAFNGILALFASIYMLYYGIKVYSSHTPVRRTVYIIIGLALLYQVIIYLLAITNVLAYAEINEKIEYHTLIRPIVSVYFLAPVAMDMIQRKFGGLK